MSAPSVTAIVPARDAERFVGEAIESILAQTHPVAECIVVDDGSRDGTAAVVSGFGDQVRLLQGDPEGVAAARNKGAAIASGDLLAFLDADDRWRPERLAAMIDVLRREDSEAVLCASRVVGEPSPVGEYLRLRPARPTLDSLLLWRGTVVPTGSNLLITREAFEGLGGFDERLAGTEDWELLVRLVARGRFAYLDEPLVEYRWHDSNTTQDVAHLARDIARAYDVILDDRPEGLTLARGRARRGRHRHLAAAHWRFGRASRAAGHAASAALADPAAVVDVVGARAVRLGRATDHPALFAARETVGHRGRVGEYRIGPDGPHVVLRHRTEDVETLEEILVDEVYTADVEPGLVVADVGANIGIFAAWALARWRPRRIIAVEPDPVNLELLHRTVARNGQATEWSVIEAMAGTADGEGSLLALGTPASRPANPGEAGTRVRVRDAFELLDEADVVKIDIEGGEWALLADPRFSRLAARTVLVEHHPEQCPGPDARAECRRALAAAGYEVLPGPEWADGYGILCGRR